MKVIYITNDYMKPLISATNLYSYLINLSQYFKKLQITASPIAHREGKRFTGHGVFVTRPGFNCVLSQIETQPNLIRTVIKFVPGRPESNENDANKIKQKLAK